MSEELAVVALRSLERRANMQASAHSMLRDAYAAWNTALSVISLSCSSLLLAASMASVAQLGRVLHVASFVVPVVMGISSSAVFSLTLWLVVWRPAQYAAEHGLALHHYTKMRHACREALREERYDHDYVRALEQRYLDTEHLPTIPDRKFLKLKRRHLQKVALSHEIDRDPWASIASLRRRVVRRERGDAD